MAQKCFWCGIVIVALTVGLAVPAKAVDPEGVLIIIAATAVAAAITVVTLDSVHHRRKKIVVTGCVIAGEKGMTLTDDEDRKIWFISGNTPGIKPGDRMTLQGKKVKGPDKTRVWEAREVIKDFGVCQGTE